MDRFYVKLSPFWDEKFDFSPNETRRTDFEKKKKISYSCTRRNCSRKPGTGELYFYASVFESNLIGTRLVPATDDRFPKTDYNFHEPFYRPFRRRLIIIFAERTPIKRDTRDPAERRRRKYLPFLTTIRASTDDRHPRRPACPYEFGRPIRTAFVEITVDKR